MMPGWPGAVRSGIKTEPEIALLCNPCGLAYADMMNRAGLMDAEMNPYAMEQLARGNQTPLAKWMRKYFEERKS
jgi:hypothetical protein